MEDSKRILEHVERRAQESAKLDAILKKMEQVAQLLRPHSGGDSKIPARPPGMALPREVTKDMQLRQTQDPKKWTLSLQQWVDVIEHCMAQPEYIEVKERKRHMTMYDINDIFVKAWTRTTGCGVSVLMSKGVERDAGLMFCHACGEDVEECLTAVKVFRDEKQIHPDTPVWFCVFANYQPDDGAGPTLQEQLNLEPFTAVIESAAVKQGQGMVVIQTSLVDIYTRLWCVHEVDRALQNRVPTAVAMSQVCLQDLGRRVSLFLHHKQENPEDWLDGANINVNTKKAACGSKGAGKTVLR